MLPYLKSLIIVPTYNEIDNVERMVRALFQLYPEVSVLIVDDNSPDQTGKLVKNLQDSYPNLFLIERDAKKGLGTAYVAGMKWGLLRSFDYFFEMDCDFSHDPADIALLLQSATEGNDLVIGSRYIGGIRIINWPFKRLLLSYFASVYTRFVTGISVKDTTGGFKCFRRHALESIDLERIASNGYAFQLELNYKLWAKKFKIKEVPIIFYERRDGKSKMDRKIILEAMFSVFILRIKKSLKILS